MSIHLMSLVWEVEFATPTQKLIMLRLADYADDDGNSVFPSIDRLARQVGASKRQTQYAVRAIEGCGLMTCVHKGGNGPKDTNRWQIDVDLIIKLAYQELKLNGGHDQLEVVENKGANIAPYILRRVQSATLRVQSATDKGAMGCTQPFKDPSDRPLVPADAGAKENSGKLKKAWTEQRRYKTAHVVKAGDPSWPRWVDWFTSNRPDRLGELIGAGKLTAFNSLWPSDDCITPRIEAAQLSEQSKRLVGGDA